MLLTPIGADKQLHATSYQFGITRVSKILYPLINEIQIEINTFSQRLR